MYPVLSHETLFVEEDGHVFVARPGEDVRKLTRLASAVWMRCTGDRSLQEIIAGLAAEQGLTLAEALNEVFDLVRDLQESRLIDVLTEPHPQPLDRWRLGTRSLEELLASREDEPQNVPEM